MPPRARSETFRADAIRRDARFVTLALELAWRALGWASRSARHPRHSLASGALRNTSACSRPVGPARTLPSASVGLCQEGRMHQEKTVAGWRNGFGVWWDVIVGRG